MQIQSVTFNSTSCIRRNNKKNITMLNPYHSNASLIQNPIHTSFGSNFLTCIDGITCPCCGIKMISPHTFLSKLNKTTLVGASAKAVEVLIPFEQNMHSTERKSFFIIKKLSKKYPNASFEELLAKEAPKHLYRLQLKELRVLDQIDLNAKGLPEELHAQIAKVSKNGRDLILNESIENFATNENPFKRRFILDVLEDLQNKNPDNEQLHIIVNIARKLPNSSTDTDAFLVKYSRRGQVEIGQRLVSKSVSTIEHIHPTHPIDPNSPQGESSERNYLAECAGCNNKRGSILLNDWMAMNPNMFKNLKTYMREIKELIRIGRLVGHISYPKTAAKTIKCETIENERAKEHPNKKLIGDFLSLNRELNLIAKAN